jgi:hypothetical protein
MNSLNEIMKREENTFYLPLDSFDEKDIPKVVMVFRVSRVFTVEASAMVFKTTVVHTSNEFQTCSVTLDNLSLVEEFTRINFFKSFVEHYSTNEVGSDIKGLRAYFENRNACGNIYLKNNRVVGVMLYNDYKMHPGLKKKTRHIGYWGYDSSSLSRNEIEYIKSEWISFLRDGLNPQDLIDGTVQSFNMKSVGFAEKLGFKQQMWRFDRKAID